jgi:hypothetical protein
MIRPRPLATLLLVAAFAACQLLTMAGLLHCHCNPWGPLVQGPAAPVVHAQEGVATPRSMDECPACMLSGLSAILSPGPSVFAPTARVAAVPLPADAAVRALLSEDLRSRAPPSA